MSTRGVEWGPVGTWAGAIATVLVVITTALVALGYFDSFRGPRLRLTFEAIEPWCRQGKTEGGRHGPVGPGRGREPGRRPGSGCLGRLINVTTNGAHRPDVDPVQLRWAGVPRSRAFDPMDLRPDQREYLNVLCLAHGSRWRLVTFRGPRLRPGLRHRPATGSASRPAVLGLL
jgi:hypothetical protein